MRTFQKISSSRAHPLSPSTRQRSQPAKYDKVKPLWAATIRRDVDALLGTGGEEKRDHLFGVTSAMELWFKAEKIASTPYEPLEEVRVFKRKLQG